MHPVPVNFLSLSGILEQLLSSTEKSPRRQRTEFIWDHRIQHDLTRPRSWKYKELNRSIEDHFIVIPLIYGHEVFNEKNREGKKKGEVSFVAPRRPPLIRKIVSRPAFLTRWYRNTSSDGKKFPGTYTARGGRKVFEEKLLRWHHFSYLQFYFLPFFPLSRASQD